MGFFSKLLGGAAAAPIKVIGDIVDDIHTSKEEKADAEIKLTEVVGKLQALQADITKSESQHRSLFIAGWRPSVGWLCSVGLAVNFVVAPILSPWVVLETPDPDTMISLVLALCGIGGLRTIEKTRALTR
jgi:hypothetical protein